MSSNESKNDISAVKPNTVSLPVALLPYMAGDALQFAHSTSACLIFGLTISKERHDLALSDALLLKQFNIVVVDKSVDKDLTALGAPTEFSALPR